MSSAASASFRRLLLFLILVAAGGAVFAKLRARSGVDAATPEWPPFEPRIVPTIPPGDRPDQVRDTWTGPTADGTPPEGYPVKVKVSSGIFHVPGGRFYDRTTADRCYPSAAAAEADGYRPAKS